MQRFVGHGNEFGIYSKSYRSRGKEAQEGGYIYEK